MSHLNKSNPHQILWEQTEDNLITNLAMFQNQIFLRVGFRKAILAKDLMYKMMAFKILNIEKHLIQTISTVPVKEISILQIKTQT